MKALKDLAGNRVILSFILFFVPLAVYLKGFSYSASGDTKGNEILALSILREGDFDFNEFCPSGDENELGYVFEWNDGRLINICPVVTGLATVPVFAAASVIGVDMDSEVIRLNLISMSLVAALSVVMMFHVLLRRGFKTGLSAFLAFIFAFGTLVWSVTSRGTWQHGPSILFLTSGLFFFFSRSHRAAGISGFFFALMAVNRPVGGLIVLPFYLYVLFRRREILLPMVLWSIPPLAFLVWYSLTYWGSILSLGQGQSGKFTSDPWLGIPGLLLSPARGLLVFSPVFFVSAVYMVRDVFRRNGEVLYRYVVSGFIATLLAYTIWERWYGGHCFGYRYLSEYIPIMVLFLAEGWKKYVARSFWTKAVFALLAFFSLYFNFLGARLYPQENGFNTFPDNIDYHPERLWDISDTELVRLHRYFIDQRF